MPNSNKLSIYLIKDEFSENDNFILKDDKEFLCEIADVGIVYYQKSELKQPKWIHTFFKDEINTEGIFSANTRLVMIVRTNVGTDENPEVKTFALSMGYGKFMFKEDVIEEDFGLKIVLNTITTDCIRRINKTNIGGNLKTSNEQLPLNSEIEEFGFDIERDMIGAVTGRSFDKNFMDGMITGAEIFSATAAVDIGNVVGFLKKAYGRYQETKYREKFPWIDYIKKVKDSRLIKKLDELLLTEIQEDSPNVWMAVPEVIEWENIAGFNYAGYELMDDIDIKIVKEGYRKGLLRIEQLKVRGRIVAVSADDEHTPYRKWYPYKCICGEVDYENKSYCINAGKWFCIDKDFVNQINEDYNNTVVSDMQFIDFVDAHDSENAYSIDMVSTDEEHFLCMDKKNIQYGGGQSKIELCDILTTEKNYIHIKPYSGSATLSHLFNQAVVSAELVVSDAEFRRKANEKIRSCTDNEQFIIKDGDRPNVIIAIISKSLNELPTIPFFSKVALKYTKRRLEAIGCKVSIKRIRNLKSNQQGEE